jgi:hypothetical protein
MSEYDRRIVVAFGAIGALLTIFAFWHVVTYNYKQGKQREEADSYLIYSDEDYAKCAAEGANFDRLACLAQTVTANQEQQRGRADLHAQQDMATWAVALLWVSGISVLVSVAGIILIYATLHETREMTLATREIGKNQTKAYVAARSARIEFFGDEIATVEVEIENTGQTPCGELICSFEFRFCAFGNVKGEKVYRPFFDASGAVSLNHIRAGQSKAISHVVPEKVALMVADDPKRSGEDELFVLRGSIFYHDVFGDMYRSDYCFFTTRPVSVKQRDLHEHIGDLPIYEHIPKDQKPSWE